MRYKHILTVIFCSLPMLIAVRSAQLIKNTDHTTGFFTQDKTALLSTVYIAFIILIVISCCATIKRAPLKIPKVRKPLCLASFIMALAVFCDICAMLRYSFMGAFHSIIVVAFGAPTAMFFIAFGIKGVENYSIKKILYVLPTLYYIVRIIFTFISVSSLALISENAYMILGYCSTALFFLQFAKLANGYDKSKGYKKVLITGVLSLMFNTIFSLPQMLLLVTDANATWHRSFSEYASCALTSLFVTIYLLSFFSNKNLKHKRYRAKIDDAKIEFLETKTCDQQFYYGDD